MAVSMMNALNSSIPRTAGTWPPANSSSVAARVRPAKER
jgi:hypothetical protein